MSKLVVWGTPVSTYVRTVRLLLEEIGADYTLQSVDIFNGETQSPEYLAKNPFGKVPTLEVNGECVYETAAITEYLDATLADRKFSFSEPMLQARMRQINAIAPAQKAIAAIESLATASHYLLGSQASIADFYLIPIFIYFSQTPEFEVITAQTPKLRTWWDRVSQLPSVKKVCA
jgi:glutathione S-transferase